MSNSQPQGDRNAALLRKSRIVLKSLRDLCDELDKDNRKLLAGYVIQTSARYDTILVALRSVELLIADLKGSKAARLKMEIKRHKVLMRLLLSHVADFVELLPFQVDELDNKLDNES